MPHTKYLAIEEYLGLHPIEMLNIWLLRIVLYFSHIIEGIIGLLFLGLWSPNLPIRVATRLLRYRCIIRSRQLYD
jgi:hypothetical protein